MIQSGKLGKLLASCKTEEEFVGKWCDLYPFQGKLNPNQSLSGDYFSESLDHNIDQKILARLFWLEIRKYLREEKLKRLY